MATDAPGIGEPVTSIGFPGLNIADTDGIDFDALFSGGKTSAEVLQDSRLQPVNTSGTIIARQYRHGVAVYQVSADFDQGMSGGPTINAHGQVLGINSQMTIPFLGQNFNVITDTAPLREYLAHGQQQAASVPGTEPVRSLPTTGRVVSCPPDGSSSSRCSSGARSADSPRCASGGPSAVPRRRAPTTTRTWSSRPHCRPVGRGVSSIGRCRAVLLAPV